MEPSIHIHTSSPVDPILSKWSLVHTHISYCFEIHFNKTFISMPVNIGLCSSGFRLEILEFV
jgi:hypothetical protein